MVSKKATTIMLTGSMLKLTEEAAKLLLVQVGDRVCVRFNEGVVIATPSAIGEEHGGNLLSKTLGTSCKGKMREQIQAFGEQFTYELQSEGYLVLTPVSADELNQEIQDEARDTNIVLSPVNGEEIDFEFDLRTNKTNGL